MRATATAAGFQLDGYSPWATGAVHVDAFVTGAVLPDGQQVLLYVPADLPGVACDPPQQLVALSASATGKVTFDGAAVPREYLLNGPAENVMRGKTGGRTGGLQTSTLALGLSGRCIDYLADEAQGRPELAPALAGLQRDYEELVSQLFAIVDDAPTVVSPDSLRAAANSLVLRASQAALVAAKGAGYVASHPAGRWCREALFFLVWSCPQPVMAANLCELACIVE